MRILIDDLRAVTSTLIAHLEARGPAIELEHDYYWSIPQDARYDPHVPPKELTIGQLSDDWRELQRIASGDADPLGYGLVWLAAVLAAVGETIVG